MDWVDRQETRHPKPVFCTACRGALVPPFGGQGDRSLNMAGSLRCCLQRRGGEPLPPPCSAPSPPQVDGPLPTGFLEWPPRHFSVLCNNRPQAPVLGWLASRGQHQQEWLLVSGEQVAQWDGRSAGDQAIQGPCAGNSPKSRLQSICLI